jgi:small subunit ribosomal protein S1
MSQLENFSDSFEHLFEQSMTGINLSPGAVVKATVISKNKNTITVNAGLKSDAIIDAKEFADTPIEIGDQIEVVVEYLENGFGQTRLSHEKAKRSRSWVTLEEVYRDGTIITGIIQERVKGGFTVQIGSISAFLPGSLVDTKPIRDTAHLEGRELEFKIIKMDHKRNNVVVSRRAVMEAESDEDRKSRISELEEGQEVMGVVKNITDYGAFVDLGGVDGLLHITDMAWKRVRHPSEILNVGEEIKVKVLKFDREKNRVSLGMKQLGDDPWKSIAERYPVKSRIKGHVSNVTDYGCFVEIEAGVEGLVHMSEMDWTNKNIHPSKVVKVGQEIDIIVLEINEDRRRISLGIKQCQQNPWQEFASKHEVGSKVKGTIRSMTDFGVFIGLPGGIDGLVHLSDLSWNQAGEEAVHQYNKGDEVQAIVLAIDADRERISLGIKQLEADPLEAFLGKKGSSEIEATVTEVSPKSAVLDLGDDKNGILHISEYQHDKTENLQDEIKVGDKLTVKVTNLDRKSGEIYVSRKILLATTREEIQRVNAHSASATSGSTLGDLLKQQMDK